MDHDVWTLVRKIWKDPVWSAVIAASIPIGIAWVTPYDSWIALWKWILDAIAFFGKSTEIQNWLLSILIIICAITVIGLGVIVILLLREKGAPDPIKDYRTDNFLGMVWRWKYGSPAEIYDLVPFCPCCDFQIIPRFSSAFSAAERYSFRCEDCGNFGIERSEPLGDTLALVQRLIHKKIRSGEWNSSPHTKDNKI